MTEQQRRIVERELKVLLDSTPLTKGMTVRVQGSSFVLGRPDVDPDGPFPDLVPDDRLRLTAMSGSRFSLSVHRHTGRWEKTPFSGTLPELFDVICATMQHLVAAW
jgi:hypothetical protein